MTATDELFLARMVLEEARELITGPRQEAYGPPRYSFERIASLWSTLLGIEIEAHTVAVLLAALKLSRLVTDANRMDSWADLAGYAALGAELALRQEGEMS